MATNFEFYKDEILKIINTRNRLAKVNGKPVTCVGTDCEGCEFYTTSSSCDISTIKWLYEEHTEQPKLTKRERAFCEAVQEGWIARDECGDIFWCKGEPKKRYGIWSNGDDVCIDFTDLHLFSFIKWEDEKPWSVEDLLKLEVK